MNPIEDTTGFASAGQPALQVQDIGSFHVGGDVMSLQGMAPRLRFNAGGGAVHPIDPNGEISVGQMYVQYIKLQNSRSRFPLLLWHGGGMTGVNWETTPDGRAGWQMFFLRAGFDVFVSDAVERGRSGWAPYPEIYPEAPYFRTAREAWEETFRFGPAGSWSAVSDKRRFHDGLRFPVAAMETFTKQFVPRWSCNDVLTQSAYDTLVARLGNSIVLTHSQGGNFGLHAALHAPACIKAVISLEPSDAPDPSICDPSLLRDVPHLFLWGDYLDQHAFWRKSVPNVRRWYDALVSAGVDACWNELPASGIRGNSHALMADDNSDQIAGIVLDWIRQKGLVD